MNSILDDSIRLSFSPDVRTRCRFLQKAGFLRSRYVCLNDWEIACTLGAC